MNERIRELYEQARLSAKSIDADIDPKGWMDLYHQKFAELIVKEYAQKTIQGLMGDPAFVQAMDEYYEQKWAHRFD